MTLALSIIAGLLLLLLPTPAVASASVGDAVPFRMPVAGQPSSDGKTHSRIIEEPLGGANLDAIFDNSLLWIEYALGAAAGVLALLLLTRACCAHEAVLRWKQKTRAAPLASSEQKKRKPE